MNIKIEISAPGLEKALNVLAASINQTGSVVLESPAQVSQETVPPQQQQPVQYQNPVQPSQQSAVPTSTPQPAPAQTAGIVNPQQSAVPTTEQAYTMDQLAVAATQLMDAGRQPELVQLLNNFGVQALTALPKEQYGAFATQLRGMGAKI
jgi:hypothetical protein